MYPKTLLWILLKFKKNNFSQPYAFGCFFLISYNIHEKQRVNSTPWTKWQGRAEWVHKPLKWAGVMGSKSQVKECLRAK